MRVPVALSSGAGMTFPIFIILGMIPKGDMITEDLLAPLRRVFRRARAEAPAAVEG